jgi:hypothetical protein
VTRRNWRIYLMPPLVAAIILACGCHKPELPKEPPRIAEDFAIASAPVAPAVPAPTAAPSG